MGAPLAAELAAGDCPERGEHLGQELVEGPLPAGADLAEQLCDGRGGHGGAAEGPLRNVKALESFAHIQASGVAGLRLATGLGVATVTYALNPDIGPSRGKVHVGLQVGL